MLRQLHMFSVFKELFAILIGKIYLSAKCRLRYLFLGYQSWATNRSARQMKEEQQCRSFASSMSSDVILHGLSCFLKTWYYERGLAHRTVRMVACWTLTSLLLIAADSQAWARWPGWRTSRFYELSLSQGGKTGQPRNPWEKCSKAMSRVRHEAGLFWQQHGDSERRFTVETLCLAALRLIKDQGIHTPNGAQHRWHRLHSALKNVSFNRYLAETILANDCNRKLQNDLGKCLLILNGFLKKNNIQAESWLRIRKLEAQGPSNSFF